VVENLNYKKVKKRILIWGYLASFTLLLGAIFLNHNFVAGKVLYLTGFFAFNIGYLIPLFLVIFKNNQENKIGLVLIFGILGFIIFLTGVSFFVVNWGGGIILIYVGAGVLILAILTIILLSRRFYETHIDSWFPVLIFGVFIVGSLLIGMVHRHVMRAFAIRNIESVELYHSINEKNSALYNELIKHDTVNANTDTLIQILNSFKTSTELVINHIEQLKVDLVKKVEGDTYKMFDGKMLSNLVPVQSNVEINTVSRYMLRKKKGKAYELKKQLENYQNLALKLIPKNDSILIKIILLNLKPIPFNLNNRRFNKNWEYRHFYNLPLITVLSELSYIQMRIAIIEGEILNHYYKKYNNISTY